MRESNYQKYVKFLGKVLRKLKPRFSFHYVAYTTLFFLVIFSVLQLVSAATPNPGHPWTELGDGVFIFTNGATDPLFPKTYTFPNANATVLTTNTAVTVGQGGTGLTTIPAGSILAANSADTLSAVTFATTGTKVLTNTNGTITWETGGGSMVYPGSGIPNSTGSSWGTSYTTSGSGTVLALTTSPVFTTPSLGVATATSVDFGTTTLLESRQLTVDTGGGFDINLGTASGDDFTVDTSSFMVEGDTGYVGVGTIAPTVPLEVISEDQGLMVAYRNFYNHNSGAVMRVYKGRGTASDPRRVINGDTLGGINAFGYYASDNSSTATVDSGARGQFLFMASEDHTSTANGTYFKIGTTANGSTTLTERMRIEDAGNIGIGVTDPTAYLHLKAGTATAETAPLKFTAGTNLTAAEAGAMEWDGTNLFITQTTGPTRKQIAYTTDITGGSWNTITSPTGTQSLTFDDAELNTWTVSSDTETFHTYTANSLTTGKILSLASSSLTSGSLLDLSSSGTGALTGQKGLNISLAGTNGTSTQTTYGAYLSNTHAGSGTNVGLYTTVSGGTNNLGLNVDAGQTLLGGTTLTTEISASQTLAKLNIVSTMSSDGVKSAIAGIHGYYTFNNGGNANYTQVGNRFYFDNAPTTNSNTMAGEIIRVNDDTSLANLVRGIDVNTVDDSSNTAGTNTGIRAKGGTFGVQGITNSSAGGVSVPAALYGENTGSTNGDILRLFSNSVTSAPSFATFYHDTSTFTGTGLLMEFAKNSGTFSGDYVHFRYNSNTRFKVTNAGITSMGLSATSSTNAVCSSLANNTAPTSGIAYEIRDCDNNPAKDYAEFYATEENVDYGDIVMIGPKTVEVYTDDGHGNILYDAPKTQEPLLVKSSEPYSNNVIGVVSNNYNDFSSTGKNLINPNDHPMPVALNGRVPVKISENSEPIAVGDYLTTSDEPGKAIKATKSGEVIGKALEAWEPNSGKEKIMFFVEQGYQNGESTADFFAIDIDSVNEDGPSLAGKILAKLIEEEKPVDDSLSEVLTDRLVAGLEVITPSIVTKNLRAEGEVNFNGLTYFNESVDFAKSVKFNDQVEFEVPPLFNSDTAGFAVIKEGSKEVRIDFDNPYMSTPVVTTSVTFERLKEEDKSNFDEETFFDQDIKSVVKDKDQTGFTIVLNKTAPQDINFSWIALAVKDAKIYESVIDGLVIEDTITEDTETDTTDTVEEDDNTTDDTTDTTDIVVEEENNTTDSNATDIATEVSTTEESTTTDTTEIITEEVSEPTPQPGEEPSQESSSETNI